MATVTLSTGTKKTGKFLLGYDNTHIYSIKGALLSNPPCVSTIYIYSPLLVAFF